MRRVGRREISAEGIREAPYGMVRIVQAELHLCMIRKMDQTVTNSQLTLVVGLPILVNGLCLLLLLSHTNTRFDALLNFWRAELQRVEDVLGARLKRIGRR